MNKHPLLYLNKMTQEMFEELLQEHQKYIKSFKEDDTFTRFKSGNVGIKLMLHRYDLTNLSLNNLNLSNVEFSHCDLSGQDLTNTSFEMARIYNCNFLGAKINSTNFSRSKIHKCNFKLTRGSKSNFNRAEIRDSSFKQACLSEVNFKDSSIDRVSFKRSKLYDAVFTDSTLNQVDFFATLLSKCNFIGVDRYNTSIHLGKPSLNCDNKYDINYIILLANNLNEAINSLYPPNVFIEDEKTYQSLLDTINKLQDLVNKNKGE